MNTYDQPIGQMIRAARQKLHMSQYALANQLAVVSCKPTIGRDRVARWENGRQVPRREWRQWLSVVLHVPAEQLDAGAIAARRREHVGPATLTGAARPGSSRRAQGTPALLPVFRSRIQAGILAATLLNPNRAFSLTELADRAGGSLASVSKEAQILEDAGILVIRHDGAIRLMRAATEKPMLAPLTELIRVTYGVPQVVGEEFGRVAGVTHIALTGTWAERFAGIIGPEPQSIEVRLAVAELRPAEQRDLAAAAERAGRRLKRTVHFTVATGLTRASNGSNGIPSQRINGHPLVHVFPEAATANHAPTVGAWPNGSDVISRMIDRHELELFSGSTADSTPYFRLASHHLATAENVKDAAAGSAFVLVCQAAQLIGFGLLAAQGLRPGAGSGDDVVGRSVTAQFGSQFCQIELLRQRVRTLNTPVGRDNWVTGADVDAVVPAVRALLQNANELVADLTLFV